MTTQTTTSNAVVQSNNLYFGPQQMTDLLLNNLIISKFGDILKDNFTLNMGTICKFLLLMSVHEIKGSVTQILSGVVPFIMRTPGMTVGLYGKCKDVYGSIKLTKKSYLNELVIPPPKYVVTITFDFNFIAALYNFIHSSKNKSRFDKSIAGINISNSKERIIIENISNIELETVIIYNPICYDIDMHTKEPIAASVSNGKLFKNISSYLDLLSENQKEMIHSAKKEFLEKYSKQQFIKSCADYNNHLTEYDIGRYLKNNYPNLDLDETAFEIGLICALYQLVDGDDSLCAVASNTFKQNKILIFDIWNNYEYDILMKNKKAILSVMVEDYKAKYWTKYISTQIKNVFANFARPSIDTKTKVVKNLDIEVKARSNSEVTLLLERFIKKIYKHNRKPATNVKIYYLLLENEVTVTEKSNPEGRAS